MWHLLNIDALARAFTVQAQATVERMSFVAPLDPAVLSASAPDGKDEQPANIEQAAEKW
jgi:hypothetical protein